MCGIAVIAGEKNEKLLSEMMKKMKHRGPDDEGTFIQNDVSMGQVRLSIIDIKTGKQPIFNEKKDKCIVYNGEVYNFQNIKKDLDERHKFATNTDTEVLLHLYEEKGSDCVNDLEGMYAFAIWDTDKLFIARDRIGIKPLYYAKKNNSTVFSSELKTLSECEDINEFPPGCTYISGKGFSKYYHYPQPKELSGDSDIITEKIRISLSDAVEKRLVSDVPVGIFLSGGLDSSIIASVMKRKTDILHSFSVGTADSPDLYYAKQVAEYLGTVHHEYIISDEELFSHLEEIIYYLESYDGALIRSAVANFFVSKLARQYVKVILTGEGADELFSGYSYLKKIEDKSSLFAELNAITSKLHNTNLQRTDRMTMAHSVEARVPFLDHSFIELIYSIPVEMRMAKSGIEKWLLRKAFEKYLPPHIAWRPKLKFSEGSKAMDILKNNIESLITDREFESEHNSTKIPLKNKEEVYYFRIFKNLFGKMGIVDLVGRTNVY
jgi:asparagine synthase (glutamine-hydrolysing)